MRLAIPSALLVGSLLVGALLAWGLLSSPLGEREANKAKRGDAMDRTVDGNVTPERSEPAQGRTAELPRLSGSPRGRDPTGVHEESPQEDAAEPACDAAAIAQMLHGGTPIERLWGQHVRDVVSPSARRWINEALDRLETSEVDSFWKPGDSRTASRITLRLRLLKARKDYLRDLGFDLRGLGGSAVLYLDDIEVRIVELTLERALCGIGLEDEEWLSSESCEPVDVFLTTAEPWPRLGAGHALPLGAAVRVHPVLSPDGRFVTLGLQVRVASRRSGEPRTASADTIAIRKFERRTVVMPDGGTLLLVVGEEVWVPPGAPSLPDAPAPKEEWIYVLVQITVE